MSKDVKVAVDFDGTLVENNFPEVGSAVPGAVYWLKRFAKEGAKIILFTMRSKESQQDGDVLSPAVAFCKKNGIDLYGINEDPDQYTWSASPKANADVYIDDKAFGCPLREPPDGGKSIVDWDQVGPEVLKIIKEKKSRKS